MREQFEKRFGTVAVEKGFITKGQLVESIHVQLERDLTGMEHRPIGSILYSLGFITISEINEVLECIGLSTRRYQAPKGSHPSDRDEPAPG